MSVTCNTLVLLLVAIVFAGCQGKDAEPAQVAQTKEEMRDWVAGLWQSRLENSLPSKATLDDVREIMKGQYQEGELEFGFAPSSSSPLTLYWMIDDHLMMHAQFIVPSGRMVGKPQVTKRLPFIRMPGGTIMWYGDWQSDTGEGED